MCNFVLFKLQVIKTVKAKIGMRSDADCFALYEQIGGSGEFICKIMAEVNITFLKVN